MEENLPEEIERTEQESNIDTNESEGKQGGSVAGCIVGSIIYAVIYSVLAAVVSINFWTEAIFIVVMTAILLYGLFKMISDS